MPKMKTTHHVHRILIVDHAGTHDGGEVHIHTSRLCHNCAHYGPHDESWVSEGGLEQFGSCINLCSAVDAQEEKYRYCVEHQTTAEFVANLHRPHRPAFALVAWGAL